ncbi:helix-turn-helix domain-containing protein [Caulobacter segnis]|jgi:transcriptional regulator with XRE-family HTH domain|uniref:helix-turn-helix domain-containing protein n=1 Tax=Caulobacter segnis TaxID=88688 RepID=UPI001CBF40ED|nr:helix-turn-helix domain-containing protein [Caulobacter segnis]UAL11529.1 helix-turn-helix domain-containing protein [Caulobacter segnis]
MAKDTDGRRASSVDHHVGARVRMRRKLIGVSQEQLADALELTFQQVQKYERGENRISASKLFRIASLLGTDVTYFFDGLPDPVEAAAPDGPGAQADRTVQTFLQTAEGLQLAELFPRIAPGRVRRQIVDLVRVMAEEA